MASNANMEPGFEVIGSSEVSNRLTLDKESRHRTSATRNHQSERTCGGPVAW